MRHLPVIDKPPRHRGKYPALLVAVVCRHTWMGPDQLLMLGVDLTDVLVVGVLTHVDRGDAVFDHLHQAGGNVTRLAFRLKDHAAAMRRTGIWAEHRKEIREARHRQAEISGRIIVGPGLREAY